MTAGDRARDRWGLDDAARAVAGVPQPFASRTPKQGSCNTLFEDKIRPPDPRIGIDTISWCWSDGEAVDRFLRLEGLVPEHDHRPLRVVPAAGGAVRLSNRLNGLGTVGAFPGASLLFIEGRAGALYERDETNHRLGRPHELDKLEHRVHEQLGDLLGHRLETGGLRRVDLSGELRFERGEHGREFLWLVDQLHSPNHKTSPVREKGGPGVETAYWRTPKRSIPVLRAYDKGVESGTAPAGERIRIERQLRYDAKTRSTLGQWREKDIAALYVAPISRWLVNGLTPGTAGELVQLLSDACEIWPKYWCKGSSWCSSPPHTGVTKQRIWSATKIERVLGTLVLIDQFGSTWASWSPKQRQRRMRQVRELGLLVTDRPVTVDIDQAVNHLCRLWQEAA